MPGVDSPLRHDHVQPDVPGADLKPFDPLAFVSQANEEGTAPVGTGAQVGERLVIVAAAHAEAVAVGVKADQGEEEQVEGPGGTNPAVAQAGLGDAVAVGLQGVAGGMAHKPEFAPGVGPEHR